MHLNWLPISTASRRTILFTKGTATNVCCESTAKDAAVANFKSIMVEDCLSAHTEDAHKHSLANFRGVFGDVLTVDQCAALFGKKR